MTLLELFTLLRKHLKLLVVVSVGCALAMGAYSFLFMKNTYTATTSMYVLSKQGEMSSSNLSTDLSASQMLANDVTTLLESDRVLNDTAADLSLDNLKDYDVSVSSTTTSRVIEVSVTGADAAGAAEVANALVKNVSDVATQVMDVESVNMIDEAKAPETPSGPNRVLYVGVAFLGGLFVATAAAVILDMVNTKVRDKDEVEELLGVPVIGRIPYVGGGLEVIWPKR